MELILTRVCKNKDYTEGRIEIDGTPFCDTLEPTWRDVGWGHRGRKVEGRTAIPEGRYPVVTPVRPGSASGFRCSFTFPCSKASAFMQATRCTTPQDASSWDAAGNPACCSIPVSGCIA